MARAYGCQSVARCQEPPGTRRERTRSRTGALDESALVVARLRPGVGEEACARPRGSAAGSSVRGRRRASASITRTSDSPSVADARQQVADAGRVDVDGQQAGLRVGSRHRPPSLRRSRSRSRGRRERPAPRWQRGRGARPAAPGRMAACSVQGPLLALGDAGAPGLVGADAAARGRRAARAGCARRPSSRVDAQPERGVDAMPAVGLDAPGRLPAARAELPQAVLARPLRDQGGVLVDADDHGGAASRADAARSRGSSG